MGGVVKEERMTSPVQKTKLSDEILFEEPYQRLRGELDALSQDDVEEVNLDVTTAIALVFGVLPQLTHYRDAIVTQMPGFDIARFDKIEDYTMTLSYTNTLHATATRPVDGLAELNDEGIKLRSTLQGDITALIARGFINPASIKSYTGLTGYKNVASDLQIQGQILKDNWSQVEGKCATTLAEVEHALKIAAHLLRLTGQKEQSPAVVAAAADQRKRAFTLFTRAYDDARRAIIFLRWHEEDADEIAPSLYAGRGGSKKKTNPEESIPAPAASAVQTTTPVTNTSPTATQSNANSTAKTGNSSSGNNPFMT
jgi:hypothetical protein